MTAPRIVPAYEAEALLRHGTDAELAAAAPDLAATVVALHAEVEHLRRVAALERGDESAALPGWHWNRHALHWWSDDGWSIWRGNGSSWQTWLGRTKRDYVRRGDLDDDCPIEFDGSKPFHTVWDAMNAAPRSTP